MINILEIIIVALIVGFSGVYLYNYIKNIATGKQSKCSSCNADCPFNQNQDNVEELCGELNK